MQPIYVAGQSLVHRLHPLTKLSALLLAITLAYGLPAPAAALAVAAAVVAAAASAGVAGRLLRTTLIVISPLLISLLLIQGLLFPSARTTLLLDLGFYKLWADGLWFALVIGSRLLAMALAVVLVVMTTHPADLVFALTTRGVPRSVGHVLLVALQLVPDMSARATAIQEAQRSRGLATEGALARMRSLPALIGPLIVGALVDVEERAMALDSRAFSISGPKTSLRALRDTPAQAAARAAMILLAVAVVALRLTLLRGLA